MKSRFFVSRHKDTKIFRLNAPNSQAGQKRDSVTPSKKNLKKVGHLFENRNVAVVSLHRI